MRLNIIPLCLLLSVSAIAQDTANKWTLRKAVDYAVRNNISIHQTDIQRRFAEIDLKQSQMTRIPTLGGSIVGAYSHGLSNNPTTGTLESASFFSGSIGVQSNYTIFNWFARRNTIDANRFALRAAEAGIEKAQNDISLSVANSFLQGMLGYETIKIAELQLAQSYAQLTNTNALVRAGTVPELNSLQLQAQVANDSANLIQAESNFRQSLIQLRALLNLAQDTLFDIIIPPVDEIPLESLAELNPNYVYQLALVNQPLQKMNALRLEQASRQVKAARGSMYPVVFAQVGADTRYTNINFPLRGFVGGVDTTFAFVNTGTGIQPVLSPKTGIIGYYRTPFGEQVKNNFGQSIAVGISFNIFNQHQARSQWQRAKVAIDQYQLQQQADNNSLQADIYNAYELAITALQKLHASERQVEVNERAVEFANRRYSLGLMNVLDLITTQNNLLRARIEAARNKYDYIFKMKVLEFYKGQGIRL